MRHALVDKKRIEEIDPAMLTEPVLSEEEQEIVDRGVELFNERRFWEAHEAWEEVWKKRKEESRIFFQGIIQAAAGYHLIAEKPRYRGAASNLEKAQKKLQIFPGHFLGFDVSSLLSSILEAQKQLADLGPLGIVDFPQKKLPTLKKR